MSEFAVLMPFARSNKTGKVVSILEVERGDKCNCRCLSCNTPVTARQGNINQKHFAHRTDELSTENPCSFSPVTAIALIIRQQLPNLILFNLDGWDFSNVVWEIDTTRFAAQLDAFTRDPYSQKTIGVQIPFANGVCDNVQDLPTELDFVLKINTHAMARFLFSHSTSPQLKSTEEIYMLLIDNWGDFVELLRCPEELINPILEKKTCKSEHKAQSVSGGVETHQKTAQPQQLCLAIY